MREYMSIAVRNNMHFIVYRYRCKGWYSVNIYLKCQGKSLGIWSWQESGHPEYYCPVIRA